MEDEMGHDVAVFQPFAFIEGQKIRIEGARRHGDWEVAAVDGTKVTLRCPISKREFTWDNFCYLVKEEKNAVWPQPD